MKKNLASKNKFGFTLLEMIVAVAIFAIVITIYTGIYVATVKANSKMLATQRVQNEIRYVMELITREVRLGSINYDYYDNTIINPQSVLAIRDSVGNDLYYKIENKAIYISYDGATWKNLSTPNVLIENMSFYITPSSNPMFSSVVPKQQPGVLVYIYALYNQSGVMDGKIKLETFISSRQYKK